MFQVLVSKLLALNTKILTEESTDVNLNSDNNQMINHESQEFTNTWPTKYRHDINKADYNIGLQ